GTLSLKPCRKNIVSLFLFIKSFFESIVLLARFKPDIVAGFGSIASIPVVICAWLFRITVVIHEQNVLPGRANRLLAHIADRIAVSFEQSKGFFGVNRDRVVWTGNVVRSSLVRIEKRSARRHFGLDPDKRTILVMGGSQASHSINFVFAGVYRGLPWRDECQVIHLCGETDRQALEREYAGSIRSVRLIGFLREMEYAYSAADLAICRAGATTIAELAAYRLPAVLVPYPHAYGHQEFNAKVLADKGCAIIVADGRMADGDLRSAVEALAGNGASLADMERSFDKMNSSAPASLVKEAMAIHHHE
ncbi:MAG TPA: UDP-N-acetylglucosamine--N-acetylmuramyl-(pentapeptide) pyrophosphoryl-undecaprenol N-acetylglucosamine transferase, partial [Candidatus Omnitrophota bacterium]|nr:UDP-N-acetylglucosamine--N-acetylmuramyl-(pentapeptide) pyrophosphoryl-undecaprenol N-acetylglucosamine transferase [Candidatus Omnitrophota bacterium]